MNESLLQRAGAFVAERKRILVTTHVLPDADAVGSSVALCLAIREMGKEAIVIVPGDLPRNMRFMLEMCSILEWTASSGTPAEGFSSFDGLVILDCGDVSRLGDLWPVLDDCFCRSSMLAMDHHEGHEPYASVSLVDSRAPATACLVFDLISRLGVELSPSMATALMAGIRGDTGSFTYANTNAFVFRMAAELIDRGCDMGFLASRGTEGFDTRMLALLGERLARIHTRLDGRVGWLSVPFEAFHRHGCRLSDGIPFMSFVRRLSGISVAVVLYEDAPANVKVSLRSLDGTDVGALARSLGGGGHTLAAGICMNRPLSEVEAAVEERIAYFFDEIESGRT